MWKNLAPNLTRQRLIIEGTTKKIVSPKLIKSYLLELAKVANMEVLTKPIAYTAHEMGYGGWIHWKSSGSSFYSYPTKPPLFTIDIYTCKQFPVQKIVNFTKKYFHAIEIVSKEIKI